MDDEDVLAIPQSGFEIRFVERGAHNGGRRLVTGWTVPAFAGPPLHWHPRMAESFEMLEGTMLVTIDGVEHQLTPGACTTAAPGARHRFRTEGISPIRWRQMAR